MADKKMVTIISIQDEYLSLISKQMTEIAGDLIRVRAISIKNLAREKISKDEIILLGATFIHQLVQPFLPDGVKCIVAKRGLNFVNMRKLLSASKGKKILVVNDTEQTTEETVHALKKVVFEHKYYAYHPDIPIPEEIDYVITPGEKQLVPEGLAEVIDVGYRPLALETVFELFQELELNYSQSFQTNRYMKSLVALSNQDMNSRIDSTFHKWADQAVGKNAKYYFDDIVANSKEMNEVLYIVKQFARLSDPVHIFGEIGTGKRMIAQAIHNASTVNLGPYLNINCAARPTEVLEKDLFGFEIEGKVSLGLLEMASGGTACIEEIDEIPLSLQGRLLQALEEGHIIRVGGRSEIPIKVRIITTSNTDLSLLVDENKFRRDLFHHIAALNCRIPSLSERKGDFEALIQTYLKSNLQLNDFIIPEDMIQLLKEYSWPGNVKELYNAISYMASLNKKKLTLELLPFYIKGRLQKNTLKEISSEEMTEAELNSLIKYIEEHGFLEESLAVLEVFEQGKKQCESYGRTIVKNRLREKGINLTEQQLRLRLEVLNQLELLNVRQGRSGTTISRKGEIFLQKLSFINIK